MEAHKNLSRVYDLWDEEKSDSVKKSQTLHKKQRYVPSALPKVELPSEGTSYNPSLKSYIKYVNKLAIDEAKILDVERRNNKIFELTAEEKILNPAFKEDLSFFTAQKSPTKLDVDKVEHDVIEIKEEGELDATSIPNDDVVKDEPIEIIETDLDASRNTIPKKPKQKTLKQKRRQVVEKKAKKLHSLGKIKKNVKHQLENLKSINREVKNTLKEHEQKILERKNKRFITRLTKRKKLGRGRFEKFTEPALMTNELTGSLRKLPTHCDILAERFNSFQKRNLIPIAGDRPKTVKQKLKLKDVEKRSTKEVCKGSRVI